MKRVEIINTVITYNQYQKRLAQLKYQQRDYDAFDDEQGVKETQDEIDETEKELGRFLDMEV